MLVKDCGTVKKKIRVCLFFFFFLSLSCCLIADFKMKTLVRRKGGAAGCERKADKWVEDVRGK